MQIAHRRGETLMPHDFLHQSRIFRLCHGDGAERVPRAIQFQGIRNFELASNTSECVLESAPSEVRTVELSVVSALDCLLGDLILLDRDSHLPHTNDISRSANILRGLSFTSDKSARRPVSTRPSRLTRLPEPSVPARMVMPIVESPYRCGVG